MSKSSILIAALVVVAFARLIWKPELAERAQPSHIQSQEIGDFVSGQEQSPTISDGTVSQFQRFDRNAIVILTSGPDQAPGIRSYDDDLDGVIDNTSEIGAVSSDDVSFAPWQPAYSEAAQLSRIKRIRGGSFVLSDESSAERWVVAGENKGQRWTWTLVR